MISGMEWIVALGLAALTGLFHFLCNFNSWWYEPQLKPGQAPLPPGSLGWPVFGNMAAFLRAFKSNNPEGFISRYLLKYNRVGLYRAYLFRQPSVLATTPEACKFVLFNDSLFETGWPVSATKLTGERSFAGVTGKEHLRLRKLTEPAVNSPKTLQKSVLRISANVIRKLDEWREADHIVFLTEMRKFAFGTISDILFGELPAAELNELSSHFSSLNLGMRALPINLPGTAFHRALRARKKISLHAQKIIDERRSKNTKEMDILSLIINDVDPDGKSMEDAQIVDMLVMFMNGGHESTAHLMMWVMIFLHKHPAVHQKLKAEQMEFARMRGPEDLLSLSDIRKMSYLPKVIDETLRLVNISPVIFRKAIQDAEFNGFTIPKGWHAQAWLRQVHLDPSVHPDPMNFDPDRWTKNQVAPFSFMPFGMGSRTCPGNELAKMEASVVIHYLVTGYELEPLNPGCKIQFLPHPSPTDLYPVKVKKLKM